MILSFILTLLFSFSHSAHAALKADIFCKGPKGLVGSFVEIVHKESGGYEHSFIAPPRATAKYDVSLEATRPGSAACQIDVTKISDGSHRYYLEQDGNSKHWKLKVPREDGEFRCAVKESLRKSLCDPLGSEAPAAPAAGDDANNENGDGEHPAN